MPIASLPSVALAVLLATAPKPLEAQAQQRWDHADALASEGRHDEAVEEYARAWQDLHAPAILYSWAQSERLRGHCTEAAALYERFVGEGQTPPPSYDTELLRAQWSNMLANAEHQRDACREPEPVPAPEPVPEPEPEPTIEPEPAPATTPTSSPATDTLPATRPWWRDAAGWSLVATGTASLAAGATLVGVAAWQDGRAEDLPTHQGFRDAIDRAVIEQRVGLPLLGLGGALAIGGIVRLAVVARRSHRDHDRTISLSPTPRGLVLRGRF
jgi:hypothetical protein